MEAIGSGAVPARHSAASAAGRGQSPDASSIPAGAPTTWAEQHVHPEAPDSPRHQALPSTGLQSSGHGARLTSTISTQPGTGGARGADPSPASTAAYTTATCSSAAATGVARIAERRVAWRLLPTLMAMVVVSFLDRTNLSFASVSMNESLGFSSTLYGAGSGVFFITYCIGQVPSNLALLRFGGPAWLAGITAAWGLVAGCFAAVRGPTSFLLLRLLLGLFESGAFPGIWYYTSCWFPPQRITLPLAAIESGITASQVLGAPLAAALLSLDGAAGLAGWQWLFVGEAVPALLLAVWVRLRLPRDVASANFLTAAEKAAVEDSLHRGRASLLLERHKALLTSAAGGQLRQAQQQRQQQHLRQSDDDDADTRQLLANGSVQRCDAGPSSSGMTWLQLRGLLKHRMVLYAGTWRIFHDIAGYGVLYFTPLLVRDILQNSAIAAAASASAAAVPGLAAPPQAPPPPTAAHVVLLSSVPFAAASAVHLVNSWHSQVTGERQLHIGLMWALGAAALAAVPSAAAWLGPGAAFGALTLAHVGVNGANGCQTSWVASFLPGAERAPGLALYNAIGSAGGTLGPLAVGVLHDLTNGYSAAMLAMAASLAVAAAMVLLLSEAWAAGSLYSGGASGSKGGMRSSGSSSVLAGIGSAVAATAAAAATSGRSHVRSYDHVSDQEMGRPAAGRAVYL